MHQGSMMAFFRVRDGDDPPVYFFGEGAGQTTFVVKTPRYSDFLLLEIEGYAKIMALLNDTKGSETP
jgi:hypothetical protein